MAQQDRDLTLKKIKIQIIHCQETIRKLFGQIGDLYRLIIFCLLLKVVVNGFKVLSRV